MNNSANRRRRRKLLAVRFEGKADREAGKLITDNPYNIIDLEKAVAWTAGYLFDSGAVEEPPQLEY